MPAPKPDDVMMTPELRAILAAAPARLPQCPECRRLRRALPGILAEVRALRAMLTAPPTQGGHDDDAE